MAASVPFYPMAQKVTPGKPGDPGYQGSLGKTVGAAAGSLGGVPGAAIGTVIGAVFDFILGGAGGSDPEPPKPSRALPFRQMERYQPGPTNLSDPGAAAPMGIQPNVRLAAASNIKKKLFGQGAY